MRILTTTAVYAAIAKASPSTRSTSSQTIGVLPPGPGKYTGASSATHVAEGQARSGEPSATMGIVEHYAVSVRAFARCERVLTVGSCRHDYDFSSIKRKCIKCKPTLAIVMSASMITLIILVLLGCATYFMVRYGTPKLRNALSKCITAIFAGNFDFREIVEFADTCVGVGPSTARDATAVNSSSMARDVGNANSTGSTRDAADMDLRRRRARYRSIMTKLK